MQNINKVLEGCVEIEVHPDYIQKDENNQRMYNGKITDNVPIHRCFGIVNVDGKPFGITFILKETRERKQSNSIYAYVYVLDADKIKIDSLGDTSKEGDSHSEPLYAPNESISLAKVLKDFEKSYDNGKNKAAHWSIFIKAQCRDI